MIKNCVDLRHRPGIDLLMNSDPATPYNSGKSK